MNAASLPPVPDRQSHPLRTTVPEESTDSVPPPGPRHRNPWPGLIRWVQDNTFAPEWLPERLHHPLIGYLAAALVEGAALGVILVVFSLVPDFDYFAIVALMGVVIVALGWGVGPGLFATLVSTLLLDFVTGAPRFSWAITSLADPSGLVLYLVVGIIISLLAGRSERARRQTAETAQLLAEAEARSRFEAEHTREIMGALVAMAAAIVQVRPPTPSGQESDEAVSALVSDLALPQVARRLAVLTRSVLGCRRVSIAAVEASTGRLQPVTEVGLTPEQEQAWWASWFPAQDLEERYSPAIAAALYAGEPALLDTRHLPEHFWYVLYQAQSGRLLPMRLGEELVGTLLVDYQESEHDYTSPQESLLTETLARLGALVLERDRLLRHWAEARANELALGETKVQMDTFLGIAGHELRIPLTSLKLNLQVSERRLRKLTIGENGAGAAGRDSELQPTAELLTRAAHQVERLEGLVNDLLDISRIQAGKLELRPNHVDLAEVVREAVREQQEAAPDRQIRLQCPADLSIPVYADAGRIEQVVTNYLTNALKYSPVDRPVEVGVEVEQEQARARVRDQGPGLPLEEQEQIWEQFHRARGVEVQSGARVGLGLGLFISRMIVERHHGQVGVHSAPGQGATFWFTLPLSHSRDNDD
jgi:K+-sensing histidine kinase KdpD